MEEARRGSPKVHAKEDEDAGKSSKIEASGDKIDSGHGGDDRATTSPNGKAENGTERRKDDRERRDRKDRSGDKDKDRDRDRDRKRRSRSRERDRSDRDKDRDRHRDRDRDRDRDRRRSRRSRSRDKDRDRSERKRRSRSRDRERRRKTRSRSKSPRESKDDDRKRRKSGWDSVAPSLLGTAGAPTPTLPAASVGGTEGSARPIPMPLPMAMPSPLAQLKPGMMSPLQLQQAFLQQQQLALKAAASAPSNQQLACRIYVGSLNFELSEEDIKTAFSPFGPVKSVSLTKDPLTQRSKGFAFVEYAYPDAATAALKHMNGFMLAGRQLKVGRPHTPGAGLPGMPGMPGVMMPGLSPFPQLNPSLPVMNPSILLQANAAIEAQKAAAAAAAAASGSQPTPEMMQEFTKLTGKTAADATASNRIYVGSIHWDLTSDDIKTIFEAFGTVKSCVLMPNPETGKHKGYGFVEYEESKSAEEAIQQMNGWDLGGRPIKVGRAISSAPILPTPGAGLLNPSGVSSPMLGGFPMPGMPGMSGLLPGMMPGMPLGQPGLTPGQHLSSASAIAQAIANKKVEESLSHEENLTLSTPNQRYALMQKLARGTIAGGKSSRCVVLKDMAGPEDVDDELEGEITDEATKYGIVERVVIYQERQSEKPGDVVIKIFILFQSADQAQKALTSLNGRWFGGRQIKAAFYDEKKFLAEDYSED